MTMKYLIGVAALTLGWAAAPAQAADEKPCPADLICASKPETLVKVMQDAGFRAKLETGKDGDPFISSASSGYDFTVEFYDCKDHVKCGSIQFNASFKAEDDNTPEYANRWNSVKRLIQMSVSDTKELRLRYDLSTLGGLNKTNFADVLEWWADMLGSFSTFVKENEPKK